MTPSVEIKLLDANVWIALAFSEHVHHIKAVAWFDRQKTGSCAFCRDSQKSLLRNLTNSKVMGPFIQSQALSWKSYDALAADPRVIYLEEPFGVEPLFKILTLADSPSHRVWSDAYLAAFAMAANIGFVTFDRGFLNFDGLRLELLS